jgi:peptidoglycan/xylan/chitin deacetylase (PgdA/CDA1 family)
MTPAKIQARHALGGLILLAGVRRLRTGLAILMYHAVTAAPVRDAMQMSISAELFAAHMAFLQSLDVDILPLAEAARRLEWGARRPMVSVVFDDGFVGVHDHALPALVAHAIPATVFVTTGWIGEAAFPAGEPSLGRPMTWREVGTLVASGRCTIGGHGHTHRVLAAMSEHALRDEIRRTRDLIASHTGSPPREFAYPFGSYRTFDQRTREALAAEQFDIACTTVWGRNLPGDDPLALRRLRLAWCDSPREIWKAVSGCYDWYRTVQRLQAARPS